MNTHLRLALFGLALALTGALIVLFTFNSEQRARETRARLTQLDSESFQMAERFKDQLREVNDKMRRYASFHEETVWEEFLNASQGLKNWMQEQAPRLSSPREQALSRQMNAAYESYVQRARDLHRLMESSGKTGASLADYNDFLEQSRRLMDLGQELGRAHYQSRTELAAQASRSLSQLRLSVLGLVLLLFLFGTALALSVYRDLIAPLRVKLGESQALALRNEKLAALGVLAAGVAHEIRNPLTAIKTGLFLQQRQFPAGSQAREDAQLVEREISRLERIVDQFLQFARPSPPELALVRADQLIGEVQTLLAPQLAGQNIELALQNSESLSVKADAEQLKQVLINLVHNAAESMEASGTILLRARSSRQKLQNEQVAVVILEVVDSGKGILPEVEKRLFDPFFTTKAKGTGLGLSISARIVEMHGGALQYQTRLNRGTTFGVVLPSVEDSEPMEEPHASGTRELAAK